VASIAGSALLGYVAWRIVKSRKNKPDHVAFGHVQPDFETAKAELVRQENEEAARKKEQRKREEQESRLKYEDDIELNEIRIRHNQDPDRDLEIGPTVSRGPWETWETMGDADAAYGAPKASSSDGEEEPPPRKWRFVEEPDEELENMRAFYERKFGDRPDQPRGRRLPGGGYEI
jgi:hypothetical protein